MNSFSFSYFLIGTSISFNTCSPWCLARNYLFHLRISFKQKFFKFLFTTVTKVGVQKGIGEGALRNEWHQDKNWGKWGLCDTCILHSIITLKCFILTKPHYNCISEHYFCHYLKNNIADIRLNPWSCHILLYFESECFVQNRPTII